MSNLAFDTHKFVRDLTKANMPEPQAEALAQHYANLLSDRLATKDDLKIFKTDLVSGQKELRNELTVGQSELKNEIAAVRTEMKSEIDSLRKEMKSEIAALRKEMMHLEERVNAQIINVALKTQLAGVIITCTVIGLMLKYS